MNETELVTERARSLIQLVRDRGLRVTPTNLENVARRTWDLPEPQIEAIASRALTMHKLTASAEEENPDWPLRTVPRRAKPDRLKPKNEEPTEPAPAPTESPAESKPAPPPSTAEQAAKRSSMRDALRVLLRDVPTLTAREAYDRLRADRVELSAWTSFSGIHVPQIRKELGIGGRTLSGPKKKSAPVPATTPAAQADPAAAPAPVLSPYCAFVVRQLAGIYGTSGAEVIDRIVLAWTSDHVALVASANAGLDDFRAERKAGRAA